MKVYRVSFLLITSIFSNFLNAQIKIYVDKQVSFPDLSVKIGEEVSLADIRVKIGEDITMEDFTVGITNLKSRADIILTDSKFQADLTIIASEDVAFADIRIKAGKDVSLSDIRIKIKRQGSVDFLVYNEDPYISMEKLVVSLLPIINYHLDYKFDKVPLWTNKNGIGESNIENNPKLYCCPDLNHWIEKIDGRIIKLEDGSLWHIYNEDTLTSMLWLPVDNIKISRTEFVGHYYLSKFNTITKKYESVRAICIK